jgi:AraC-like DNA-binding protein
MGRSAKRVIDERVLLEARRRLAYGGESVTQLSEALGFPEATQFIKFFKRLSGETPAAFRSRVAPDSQ